MQGKKVELRGDFTAAALRRLARDAVDVNQVRRLLAIAAVYDGWSRAEAAESVGMDRQILRDWVHRFNAEGPDGLIDRKAPGRKPLLTEAHDAELVRLLEEGPDPQVDGVVRWRCKDLKAKLAQRFGDKQVSQPTMSRRLKRLKYSFISARPRHPAQKAGAVEDFKKTSPIR